MSTLAPDRSLLTVRQAAARLGVHEKTVRRMIRSGRLPGAVRLGGPGSPVRIDRLELEAWLYSGRGDAA